jgi:hypothetical protein
MKVLNIKKATPMFTGIITTCDRYTEDECKHGAIIDSAKLNQIKDIQKIISLSESSKSRGLSEGMILSLSFERYKKNKNVKKANSIANDIDEHYGKEMYYELPTMLLDYKEHLLLDISDISMIIDDYEYITEGEGFLSGEKVADLSGLKQTLIL